MNGELHASVRLEMDTGTAFDNLVEDLYSTFDQRGITFERGTGGQLVEDGAVIARIVSWDPGERIVLEWYVGPEAREEPVQVEFAFRAIDKGTDLAVDVRNWRELLDEDEDVLGWFTTRLAAPFLESLFPSRLGDWITDRRARRPSGPQARSFYRDPLYHYPNFRVILDELELSPRDYLLEVGCGGGVLLERALVSGCTAAGIDHSLDMVRLSRETNRDSIAQHRLHVLQATASRLPFRDDTFTRAALTGVLGFLTDPAGALAEIRRTLVHGGRLVALGSDARIRGTPAAPEPMASRLRFYEDDELARLGRDAGFDTVKVTPRDLERYARDAGVPSEHLPLFAGETSFLIAEKM